MLLRRILSFPRQRRLMFVPLKEQKALLASQGQEINGRLDM